MYLKLCSVAIYINAEVTKQYINSACIPMANKITVCALIYMAITYGYFNIQNWDKDHSAQCEIACDSNGIQVL